MPGCEDFATLGSRRLIYLFLSVKAEYSALEYCLPRFHERTAVLFGSIQWRYRDSRGSRRCSRPHSSTNELFFDTSTCIGADIPDTTFHPSANFDTNTSFAALREKKSRSATTVSSSRRFDFAIASTSIPSSNLRRSGLWREYRPSAFSPRITTQSRIPRAFSLFASIRVN